MLNFLTPAVNIKPIKVLKSRDYIFVYENEDAIRNIVIDPTIFNQINLDPGGLCITAIGNNCDFVSRFFTPQSTILEDPVTGSAHCSLIPYWSQLLGKNKLHARQISQRIGELFCANFTDHVEISGNAITYKMSTILL